MNSYRKKSVLGLAIVLGFTLITFIWSGLVQAQVGTRSAGVRSVTAIPSDVRALWVEEAIIAWDTFGAATYELHYTAVPSIHVPATSGSGIPLTFAGKATGTTYAKFPNINHYDLWQIPSGSLALIPTILTGDFAIAAYDGGGSLVDSTRLQIQGVLDDLFGFGGSLGVTYNGNMPSLALWAPTARSVTLHRFSDALTETTAITTAMTMSGTTGVWTISGDATWDRQYYLLEVEVFVPETGAIERNLVTDPYAVNLSQNSNRSQFVNLSADASLKPSGWDSLVKPIFNAPEDIAIYELHVRDFSIGDTSVLTSARGTFQAFTYDGQNGRPGPSRGFTHLQNLAQAGLSHIHILPAFDIASINEDAGQRTEPDPALLATFPPSSTMQQSLVGASRVDDGFNWGYDPYHYGAPEGSYATDQDGATRILEFREMVQVLNENGLRVVMDVVYNHTAASGQFPQSVLDQIVPGYYHRYDNDGVLQNSSCCADTAAEFDMMQKLMVDTVLRWATAYKVDGFRFDLMNLHTVDNATAVRDAVHSLTLSSDGVAGDEIYLYGEGWDFGSAKDKGLNYANQYNVAGTGIGTFNDKIRDAAHGGFNTDPLQIRRQGFINGQSFDWNGYLYTERFQGDLRYSMDRLRVGLAGSLRDYYFIDQSGNAQTGLGLNGTGYVYDPQETVNYITKHDNETLFDLNVFKLPMGESGTAVTGMNDRVRSQNMGISIIALGQGVPFFHLGSDMLRSKSLDRNSYDSGDWFNRVDFTYQGNNFAVGLPPAWDNSTRWSIMEPLLANPALVPLPAQITSTVSHMQEMLQIRNSSPLFRLQTASEIHSRVHFYNTGPGQQDGLLVMTLSDAVGADLDAANEYIVVLFNAHKISQSYTLPHLIGMPLALHPVLQNSIDPLVQTTSFNIATGEMVVPARTTAVFVSSAAPAGSGNGLGWVGDMYPVGDSSTAIDEGDNTGHTVYVQVFKAGVTGSNNGSSGGGIGCILHWGRYGKGWGDLAMTFNPNFTANGNNDEHFATIPTANLQPGTYGYTAYCSDNGYGRTWQSAGDGIVTVLPPEPDTPEGVMVHLFEWKWSDVALECEQWLGPKGFSAVQVSPPQEHIDHTLIPDFPWWARYQPVSYQLISRSGSAAEFDDMVSRCHAAGVAVYVDAVINHMTSGAGTGTAGTIYTKYDYPTVPYTTTSFHSPTCGLSNYQDRTAVQTCELLGLADLDQQNGSTLTSVQAYLNDLLSRGVDGFRIDGAKHISAYDMETILAGVNGAPIIFQEVIEAFGEPVQGFEYVGIGSVTEFDFSRQLGDAFSPNGACSGVLADLQNFATGAAFLRSGDAVVFVDNHDNQRGHGSSNPCIVTHQDGNAHTLANIFMLAWPYGHARVMSSYYFSSDDQGPPADGSGQTTDVFSGTVAVGCNGSDWVCEHRHNAIANMVEFRGAVSGTAVVDWWDNGGDQIAFGRGDRGFLVINQSGSALNRVFQTGLSAGSYCDISQGVLTSAGSNCTGPVIIIDESGRFTATVAAGSAIAVHVQAQIWQPLLQAKLSSTVDLSWDGQAGQCSYALYAESEPYFDPDLFMPAAFLPATQTDFSATIGLGDVANNVYFAVRAHNCNGMILADSNHVGEFDFALQPGTP